MRFLVVENGCILDVEGKYMSCNIRGLHDGTG